MQFVNNDPLYKLIRITGPQHNLLGLQLAPGPTEGEPELEVLDRASGQPARLDGREIAEQVRLGVEEACRELNKPYYVEKIQYLAADSPPPSVYRGLARELIRRIDAPRP